jgi:serine/threonine protein kinase
MNKQLLWKMLEGKVINNQYYLKKLLGAGGFGGVFLADDVIDDTLIRQIAIKLLIADSQYKQQQLNEIIATTNLQHPNLIRCFNGGKYHLTGSDFIYLMMEVADFSLEKQLTQRTLSETETNLLVQDITEALVYLHHQLEPIVHRDLKPGNVLKVGDKWRLSDFGLVKVIGKNSVMDTINLTGTAGYAPPEAYQGKVATAWDLWSLGIIIVEVLTGRFPFSGNTLHELQHQVCNEEPNLSGLPQNFEPIVRGCLHKKRENRWTAQQVLDVLSKKTRKPDNVDEYVRRGNTYSGLWEKEQVLESYEKANQSYQEQGETYRYEQTKNQTNRVPMSKVEEIHPDEWGRVKGIFGWFSSLFDDK